jgi:cytochrome b561
MNEYLRTAFTGWASAILFGSGLALPYLIRRTPKPSTPFLRRMWPHYWLGYLTLLAAFSHAWLAMSGGNMPGIDIPGVWIATVALLTIMWQVAVGFMLKHPAQPQRRALRRTHFWTMMLVAGLIVAHVIRNRP